MQRNTGDTQSLTVEYGFLDSTKDDVQQLKNNYEDFAEAVVRAVAEYANLSYIPKEGGNTYTVKSGDSLWSIAKKYNVSVDELKKDNNFRSSWQERKGEHRMHTAPIPTKCRPYKNTGG